MRTEYRIMIAGSRYLSDKGLDYARRVVQRAHDRGYTIVVGDHPKGVDMAVVRECRRLKARVVVVGITNYPRNSGCSQGSYVKVERDGYRAASGSLLDGFQVRDCWMVDNAHLGLFIWNGESKRTKQSFDCMMSRNKVAHLITFGQKPVQHGR